MLEAPANTKPPPASFSSMKPPGAAVQPCPKSKPCDISKITVTVKPSKKAKVYRLQSMKPWKLSEAESPAKEVQIFTIDVASSTIPEDRIEVLADREGGTVPTSVQVVTAMVCTHSGAEHPAAGVGTMALPINYKGGKAGDFKFDVFRGRYGVDESTVKGKLVALVLDRFWPKAAAPSRYTVSLESCGIRASGPVVGTRMFTIEAYPVDQYGLKLSIPAFKRRSYNSKTTLALKKDEVWRQKEKSTSTLTKTGYEKDSVEAHEESYSSGKKAGKYYYEGKESLTTEGTTLSEEVNSDKASPQIEVPYEDATVDKVELTLMRNGVQDETTAAIRNIADTLIKYKKKFDELWNDIKNFMPQVGWSFDFELSWFSGDLGCTWGYRENPKKVARVHYGWTATANLQIVSASGSISFGVQLTSHVVAKLTGTLTGTVLLSGSVDCSTPDESTHKKLETKGVATLSLVGEASISAWWIKAQRKAGVSFTLEVGAALDFGGGKNLGVEVTAVAKPLTFEYERHSIWGESYYEQTELTNEKTLFSETFPKSDSGDSSGAGDAPGGMCMAP